MPVVGLEPVVVTENQKFTITACLVVAGVLDDTVRRCVDRRVHGGFQVDAGVKLAVAEDRMFPPAEFTGDPFVFEGIAVGDHLQDQHTVGGIECRDVDAGFDIHIRHGLETDTHLDIVDLVRHTVKGFGFAADLFVEVTVLFMQLCITELFILAFGFKRIDVPVKLIGLVIEKKDDGSSDEEKRQNAKEDVEGYFFNDLVDRVML